MLGMKIGGRYNVFKHLGGGGFGQTYLAEDWHLPDHQVCVVKQLKPQATHPDSWKLARELFDREAKVLHQLGKHDRIPQLLAHFEEEQEFYLVEEFIDGHDLSQEMTPGRKFTQEQTIALLVSILETLSFVHQQGVIHRDIKPSNLIRRKQDNQVVMIDFGAVKQIGAQTINPSGQTSMTVAIGSPGYMPNEQYGGKPRYCSDIYAVGIIGIQALTGLPPNCLPEDPTNSEIIWRDSEVLPPEARVPVGSVLAGILDKMVRYDYRQRYQTVTEVLQELRSLQSGETLPLATPAAVARTATLNSASLQTVSFSPGMPNPDTVSGLKLPTPAPGSGGGGTQVALVPPLSKLRRSPLLLGLSALLLVSGSVTAYFYTRWQSDQRSQAILERVRNLSIAGNSQECINQAKTVSKDARFFGDIQILLQGCALAQAKSLAKKGNFKQAVTEAGRIPQSSATYPEAQTQIAEWSEQLLKQATEQYRKGQLDVAIASAKVIPAHLAIGKTAQMTIAQWQKSWAADEKHFKAAQAALAGNHWQSALEEAEKISDNPAWQQKAAPIIQTARAQLNQPASVAPAIANITGNSPSTTTSSASSNPVAPVSSSSAVQTYVPSAPAPSIPAPVVNPPAPPVQTQVAPDPPSPADDPVVCGGSAC
ncbi:MAG: serine/threonine protein kinase [Scytolyngbya sp. HA4215-MV1]|nr:serine/threonine protein kinase [Scytolyngbya sp. HA4215-MV1]